MLICREWLSKQILSSKQASMSSRPALSGTAKFQVGQRWIRLRNPDDPTNFANQGWAAPVLGQTAHAFCTKWALHEVHAPSTALRLLESKSYAKLQATKTTNTFADSEVGITATAPGPRWVPYGNLLPHLLQGLARGRNTWKKRRC